MDGQFFQPVDLNRDMDLQEFKEVMNDHPITINLVEHDESFYRVSDDPVIQNAHAYESVDVQETSELRVYDHDRNTMQVIVEGQDRVTGWTLTFKEEGYHARPLGTVPKQWLDHSPFDDELRFEGRMTDVDTDDPKEVVDTIIRECII